MSDSLLNRARDWHRKISLMPNLPGVQELVTFLGEVVKVMEDYDKACAKVDEINTAIAIYSEVRKRQ